jgi:hypothetical protein
MQQNRGFPQRELGQTFHPPAGTQVAAAAAPAHVWLTGDFGRPHLATGWVRVTVAVKRRTQEVTMRKVARILCLAGVLGALASGTQAALASPAKAAARPVCWLCYQDPDGAIICKQVPCP